MTATGNQGRQDCRFKLLTGPNHTSEPAPFTQDNDLHVSRAQQHADGNWMRRGGPRLRAVIGVEPRSREAKHQQESGTLQKSRDRARRSEDLDLLTDDKALSANEPPSHHPIGGKMQGRKRQLFGGGLEVLEHTILGLCPWGAQPRPGAKDTTNARGVWIRVEGRGRGKRAGGTVR